jgi:hypothetical protein
MSLADDTLDCCLAPFSTITGAKLLRTTYIASRPTSIRHYN